MKIQGVITYQRGLNILTKGRRKDSKKIANHTCLVRDGKEIQIRYHQTNIITLLSNGHQILRSGGWFTRSTLARLHEWSHVFFGNGWRV